MPKFDASDPNDSAKLRDTLVRDWSEAVVDAVADENALVCLEALEAQFVSAEAEDPSWN